MSIHGALRSLEINGRTFKTGNDAPGNRDLGGRNNEVQMNGDESFRVIQTVVPGALGDIGVEIDSANNDQEYLQDIADNGLAVPVTATYADNSSYTGDLVLTGEIKPDASTGLATLSFAGGKLRQI